MNLLKKSNDTNEDKKSIDLAKNDDNLEQKDIDFDKKDKDKTKVDLVKKKKQLNINMDNIKKIMNLDIKDVQAKLKEVINNANSNKYLKKFEKKRKVVAFDIGSKSIKIAEGMYYKNTLSVNKLVKMHTPKGAIEDGKISDDKILVAKLRNILKENDIKAKDAICTNNSTLIINREIIIPLVKDEELETVVTFEIQQYLPINLDDYVLQITILRKMEEEKKMEVRVIAYPEKIARGYYDLLKKLDLRPYALDVNYNALNKLTNDAEVINDYKIENSDSIAFIDMGAESLDVNIYNNGILKFTRIIRAGESYLDEVLKEVLNIDVSEIEHYKKHEIDLTQETLSKQNDDVLREIDDWIEKIEKIIQFYKNKNNGEEIKKVFIYGGASKINGMEDYVGTKLGINTSTIKSMSNLNFKNEYDNTRINDFVNVIGSIIRL